MSLGSLAAEPATPPTAGATAAVPASEGASGGKPSPVAPAASAAPAVPEGAPVGKTVLAAPAAPSKNVVINLINRLVQRGVLGLEDSQDLIRQAEEDAVKAKTEEEAGHRMTGVARSPSKLTFDDPMESEAGDDEVRVVHVPEFVKNQMREEIKRDVLKQARDERWAAPRILPDWVKRFTFLGDFRSRYEGDYFPAGNDNSGSFPNFNAINTGAPFDTTGAVNSPQLDVDTDRQRMRLRARFGAEIDLGDSFTSGFRLATGENSSPVSENQSVGVANQGQGGNFSKYAIWLDRAFLKYEMGGQPTKNVALTLGRFDNPFFGTTMLWANDLAFDGIVMNGKYEVVHGVTPFLTAGFFPVFNNDLNFSSTQSSKFKSRDKWLAAIQGGTDWKVSKDFSLKVGGAFYDFQSIEGKRSHPFIPQNNSDQGNTDNSRPSFAQKGNTYMPLRNITPDVSNGFGTTRQWQYYGLASPFRDVSLTAKLDYAGFDPFHVWIVGDFVRNIAFDYNNINTMAVNNRAPNPTGVGLTPYVGGKTGWLTSLYLGRPALQKRWDWNVSAGYRYVESDAVVDGFNDSDFGGGGTNLKGYTLSGNIALSPRVLFGITWMSANAIAGPIFKQDILQIDLNAKF